MKEPLTSEPDLSREQYELLSRRLDALQARHEQLTTTIHRWNAEARGLGYDGVGDMLSAFRQNQTRERQ